VSPPGTQFSYNNESYYLLGLVIARVSGVPYTRWITEHVLRPAGMTAARMYDAWAVVPQTASSYAMKDGRLVHNRADIMSDRGEAIASWGLYASLDDMIAFDSALRSGKLISHADLSLMWSNGRLANGALSPTGIAFNNVSWIRGHRSASKGGQAGVDYTTYPDDGLTVILLTNMEASDWGNWYSASELTRFFDPAIQPLSALVPRADPDPARTQRLLQSMKDVAGGVSPSPLLTPALNAGVTPDIRNSAKQLLGAMKDMKFLGCEPASPDDPSAAVQYCYYRVSLGGPTLDLGFGLTRDGKLANPQGQME
jgi:CubicO group peptidase (beta-lactamase class C family)